MEQRMTNSSTTYGVERNRVLRNTYALLSLSMVPTLLGAWLGVQMHFSFFAGSPLMGIVLFLAIAFGFFYGIERFKHSPVGVALLLGFTFFMGLMLSRILQATLGFSNGGQLIALAAGGTGVIFFGMATLASVVKRDLSGLGKFLFMGVLLLLAASIANVFLQIPALFLTVSVLVCAVFSVYLMYDINRVITGGETNYIRATLAIYLDVFNIFQSLLSILGILGGNRD
jgi:modulator of FtsH protease